LKNISKWSPHPYTKTPQCSYCGNLGAKKQSHMQHNCKTNNSNLQVYQTYDITKENRTKNTNKHL